MNKQLKMLAFPLIIMTVFQFSCKGEEGPGPDIPDVDTAKPVIPHIHSLEAVLNQPQESDTNVIWYDDFSGEKNYLESTGGLDN
jgi:hypothetical protein